MLKVTLMSVFGLALIIIGATMLIETGTILGTVLFVAAGIVCIIASQIEAEDARNRQTERMKRFTER